jgi:hypothetical protein
MELKGNQFKSIMADMDAPLVAVAEKHGLERI